MTDTLVTGDSLFDGRLQCRQHLKGYRFSLDAVLLADFISPRSGDRILDLGAGCGVISLILAFKWPKVDLTALELQDGLVALALENIELNLFQERIRLVHGDLRRIKSLLAPGLFDWVICNPPYGRIGSGRLNSVQETVIARHETHAELPDITRAVTFALRTRGRVALVYPASRASSMIHELKEQNLEPRRLRVIYSYPGSTGKLILIEAMKGGGEELQVEEPFYVYRKKGGEYTDEMAECYKTN